MEITVVIGASRGLGSELCRRLPGPILAVARKHERLLELQRELGDRLQVEALDVTTGLKDWLPSLEERRPTRIFYIAGGGPFGIYESKDWKDHQWAWEVSFLAPARIIHASWRWKTPPQQIVLCGSAVAEVAGDRNAASYAAAKHALHGLYRSLRLEKSEFDLRLYSPGYLDTQLLPKGASVRYKGVWDVRHVAEDMWTWSQSADHGGHRALSHHPS